MSKPVALTSRVGDRIGLRLLAQIRWFFATSPSEGSLTAALSMSGFGRNFPEKEGRKEGKKARGDLAFCV